MENEQEATVPGTDEDPVGRDESGPAPERREPERREPERREDGTEAPEASETTDTASTDTASTDTASTDTASTDTASTDTEDEGAADTGVSDPTADDDKEDDGLGTVSELEDLGTCRRRVRATVPSATIQEHLDRNYKELAATVQLPGFRRGRVPRRLLEKRFGEEINSDLKESLLAESFAEVIKEHDLSILGTPDFDEVNFRPEDDFTYEAEITVYPEFELPAYKKLEVDVEPTVVEDSQVEEEIDRLRRQRGTFSDVEAEEIGAEDYLSGSYELWIDGAKVKRQSDVTFRPDAGNLEAFEVEDLPAQVESWRSDPGVPLVLAVTVPDQYGDEVLRGKSAELRFEVESARRMVLPELDDEFAKGFQEESLEELRKSIRESLERIARQEEEEKAEKALVAKVVEAAQVEIPDALIDQFQGRGRGRSGASDRDDAEDAGDPDSPDGTAASEDDSVGAEGEAAETDAAPQETATEAEQGAEKAEAPDGASETSEADEEARERVRQELREFLVLQRIGDKEKIFATEEEVNGRVALMARMRGLPVAEMREYLQKTGGLEEVRIGLRNQKVRSVLRKKAKITVGGKDPKDQEPDSTDDQPPAGDAEPEAPQA